MAYSKYEKAVELLALVMAHPTSVESRMLEGRIRDSAEELLALIESELTHETFIAAVKRGRWMDLDEVVDHIIATADIH